MNNINQLIEKSIKKIYSTYYKIIDNKNGTYSIIEYNGPNRSIKSFAKEGWMKHEYLVDTITTEYPIFNIFDYKAISLTEIIKKNDVDVLKDELADILQYLNMDSNLIIALKKLKAILLTFNIDYNKYNNFNELYTNFSIYINNSSLQINDKSKYILLFINTINDVYIELDRLKINISREFFNDKFKYFLVLIK